MKTQQTSAWIFLLSLVLLFAAFRPYQTTFDKISVQEFELRDKNGIKRASFIVEPNGEVVFRMMDDKGTIRIKMGAGESGSGLVLLDNNTNPGVHMLAKKDKVQVTVMGLDGKVKEY